MRAGALRLRGGEAVTAADLSGSTADLEVRLTGAVTLTIADLSRPRVGVEIDVPGHSVGAPG